ncbi:MAG TPA: TrkH family potassium uptake protein [Acidimicrobiia bacterium]|nr:TrkH family potassium uptake protein [Acidimicrobiia bacterium]
MRGRAGRSGRKLLNTVGFVLGSVLMFVAVAMLSASLVALAYRETDIAVGIAISAGITTLSGSAMRRFTKRPRALTLKEGFATVGLSWSVFALFGALPYLVTGSIPSITDAVFESVSGFTTTGFSTLVDPSAMPFGILFWRGLTNWLGGLGVIVLGVIVLPLLGTGSVHLAQAESSGHTVDRLAPRFQQTAIRLLAVYAVITFTEVLLLAFGDMSLFQAVVHSFATVATGGFGSEANSIASFSTYTQWVVVVFMFLSGVSFALHFRAMARPLQYTRNSEFRLYVTILVISCVIVVGGLWVSLGPADAVRLGVFNTVSIATGTGFATTDFGQWRPALQIMLIGLMFVGGMVGSTSGAIKTFRISVLAKAAFADVRRVVRPRAVFVTKVSGETIPSGVVEAVQSFFLFYMFIFMTGTFLLAFIDANVAEGFDLVTTASAVASSMGNVGAGLGQVSPSGGFSEFPLLAKWLLSSLMIVGRLEIFPVLVLFTKDLWKR